MSKPTIKIYDIETDTTVEREMTDTEFAQYEAANEAKKINDLQAAEKRQSALAKLAALGLEEDDLKALGL